VGETSVGGLMAIPPEAKAGGMPPNWGCYVTVDDVDATARKAVELGGKVVHCPQDIPGVGRMAVIVDPQGAALNVITYTTPSA
jgi:predicted enzyme related to lactoylglutathione lyase